MTMQMKSFGSTSIVSICSVDAFKCVRKRFQFMRNLVVQYVNGLSAMVTAELHVVVTYAQKYPSLVAHPLECRKQT